MPNESKEQDDNNEPMDNLSSLLDVAQDVDTDRMPQNDPKRTIVAENGEVINLDQKPSHTK